MAPPLRLKFLADNCVPDSVGRALTEAGHEVILLRDILPTNSPDPLVASVAELNGAILVSFDKDFKTLAPRIGIGQQRFRKLSRIAFRCGEPEAAKRLRVALGLIEFEWTAAQTASDKRVIIEIGPTYIRTVR
jgi:predicted nuclease of predicted toxin-antitoxin system